MLAETMREMAAAGVKSAMAVVLAAYSSYSSCRQYREDIERAQTRSDRGRRDHKMRVFYNHPEFIGANADRVREALAEFPPTSDRRSIWCSRRGGYRAMARPPATSCSSGSRAG